MSLPIRFVNHSPKLFFIHDVEYPCDDSNQFKDGSPSPSLMAICRLYKEDN